MKKEEDNNEEILIQTLKNLPRFEENPFTANAIKEIEEHTTTKKIYIKGNRQVLNQVINDNGEIVGQSAFHKFIAIDEDQFTKLFIKNMSAFWDLSKAGLRVFTYIFAKCIKPNQDCFYINLVEAMKFTEYATKKYIFSGLADLGSHGIIARSTNPYMYFINPVIVFNGSRITFAQTYVKKETSNNKKKIIDPNQTKLWGTQDVDFEKK